MANRVLLVLKIEMTTMSMEPIKELLDKFGPKKVDGMVADGK